MDKILSSHLSAVRGYAALIVLLAHTNQWFILPVTGTEYVAFFIMRGAAWLSVLVFFVLSGFVISNSLIINYQRNQKIEQWKFLRARAYRILPPFLFAFVLSLAVYYIIKWLGLHGAETFRLPQDLYVARETLSLRKEDVLATLFLSQTIIPGTASPLTNGALWSLPIEVWIYLVALLGAVSFQSRTQESITAKLALILLIPLLLIRFQAFTQYALYWGLGGLVCLWYYFPKRFRFFPQILIGLVVVSAPFLFHKKSFEYWIWNVSEISSVWMNLVLLALSVIVFLIVRNWVPKFLTGIGNFFSKFSYTLYIIHFPLLLLLFSCFHRSFWEWSNLHRALFLVLADGAIILISYGLSIYLENRKLWEKIIQRIFSFDFLRRHSST